MTYLSILWILCVLCIKAVDTFRQCNASTHSVKNVLHCPKNETEWTKAKALKACEAIQQNCSESESLEYHCVPTEDEGDFVEVCAIPIIVHGGFCTEWNTGGETLQPSGSRNCTVSPIPCPDSYYSNETFKYQQCYQTNTKDPSTTPSVNSTSRLRTIAILPAVMGLTLLFLVFQLQLL
ncbi:uncharacterized protein LOC134234099 [Saccostrea cucullata]|uniref:uncharacterized protein LOC134234099 n=1 Tax=Saccostrea cuccullata TaxID=36930 RepID=UPI002ED1F95A